MPLNAALLADRERRRRHHGAARMRQRRGMGIVGLVGMRQHTVRKRRLDRTREQAAADHRRDARAAISFHKTDRGLAGQKGHARDHGCDGVEHMVLALLDHVVGQRALACLVSYTR